MSVALIEADTGKVWSYAELKMLSDQCCDVFSPKPGKKLFLLAAANRAVCVAALRGLMQAGHAVFLCDARPSPTAINIYVTTYQPDGIITVSDYAIDTPKNYAAGNSFEGLKFFCRTSNPGLPLHPDLALLLTTSGSTDSQKLVRLSKRNIEINTKDIIKALALTSSSRTVVHMPMAYSYGLSVITTHLAAEASLVLCEEGFTSKSFWQALHQHGVTSLSGIPYHFTILKKLGLESLNLPDLKLLTQAGGRMEPELIQFFAAEMEQRGGRLIIMYGQTEAAPRITALPFKYIHTKLGSVGMPMAHGSIAIEKGEIIYSGPNVMMGYAENRADLARGDDLGGHLATGDLGYLDEDGFLYITGRKKRLAKIDGQRISLDEVETIAGQIAPTVAFEKDGRLILLTTGEYDAVYRRAVTHVHIHPSRIVCRGITHMPLLASGKIDLQALTKLL